MTGSSLKIDEIDVKILKTMLENAREKFSKIARECGVSTNTIVKRFYKMKKSGIISGTSLMIDRERLGYKFNISIDLNVQAGMESYVVESLKKLFDLFVCYQVLGKYDIHASIPVKTFEEVEKVREKIKTIKGITRIGLTASLDNPVFFPDNLLVQPTENGKSG